MAISIDWHTKLITLNQTDSEVSLVSGTTYELDTYAFFRTVISLADDEAGMPFDDPLFHKAKTTISGVIYVDSVEIINGYTLLVLPDSSWRLRMDGATNNNFHDEGVLVLNNVQVIPANSAGNTISETGTSGLTPDESQQLLDIDSGIDDLIIDVANMDSNVMSLEAKIDSLLASQSLTNEQKAAEHTTIRSANPLVDPGTIVLRNTTTLKRWEADAWEDEAGSIGYRGNGMEKVGMLAEVAWS